MATRVLLRLLEPATEVLPSDEAGGLVDLHTVPGLAMPPVLPSFTGTGREFAGGRGLVGVDKTPGASLLTRTLTIQAIVSWDASEQDGYSTPGAICCRGIGGSPSEFVAYALELRVVDYAQGIGEVRWWWQDLAGVARPQRGGYFRFPPSGGFFLVTATRVWVSTTHVELAYFIGDRLVGSILSSDGDIGGGLSGTFSLGCRFEGGSSSNYFHGVIDQLRILDEEISLEEASATWRRMAVLQPRGYQALLDLLPRMPVSDSPTSNIQRLFRILGNALGYGTAQIDNFRDNTRPNRAYGPVLAEWEYVTGAVTGRGGDRVPRRRARVLSTLRQKGGAAVSAMHSALADVLDIAPQQLRSIAFDQTVRDDFSAGIQPERWSATPFSAWSATSGSLRVQASSSIPYTGYVRHWLTCLTSVQAHGRAASFIAKFTPTQLDAGGEVGVVFIDRIRNNGILLGLRNDGGTYRVVSERFRRRVSQGVVVEQTYGAKPSPIWLFLHQQDPGGGAPDFVTTATDAFYDCGWSTTSGTAGYSIDAGFTNPARFQWAGIYARSISGNPTIDVLIDETVMRAPFGDRSSRFYVFRDPMIPGSPDLVAAHALIRRTKQAHTQGAVITDTSLRCDSEGGCDRGPMGAL